jgi:hypothetical protein
MRRIGFEQPKKRPVANHTCTVEGCGRPEAAKGLCQTHRRHVAVLGHPRPIRSYRERTSGTVKFAGLRLSPGCVRKVRRFADARGLSPNAAVQEILEAWHASQRSKSV